MSTSGLRADVGGAPSAAILRGRIAGVPMALRLFQHPLSSYSQKALIALYENDVVFERMLLEPGTDASLEIAKLWPINKFPVLLDGDRVVPEATIIIEYLQVFYPGAVTLIPADPAAAIDVRLLDRFFDNYMMTPQTNIVLDALRPEAKRDSLAVEHSRALLDKAYLWLEHHLSGRIWGAGDGFSLADCAAAPALLYADWTHPIPPIHQNVWSYRTRLLQRPSYARILDEARPYRHYFPLGAPTDRD